MPRRGSTTPLELAHAIASDLASDDVHGRFTVSGYGRGDATWHVYEALFDEATREQFGDVSSLEFLISHWGVFIEEPKPGHVEGYIPSYYSGKGIVNVLLYIDNGKQKLVEGWRSLTRARSVEASFGQVKQKVQEWSGSNPSSKYAEVLGVSVEVQAGANYKRERLYL